MKIMHLNILLYLFLYLFSYIHPFMNWWFMILSFTWAKPHNFCVPFNLVELEDEDLDDIMNNNGQCPVSLSPIS